MRSLLHRTPPASAWTACRHAVLLQRRPNHTPSGSVSIGILGMRASSAGHLSSAMPAAELPPPALRWLILRAIVRRIRSLHEASTRSRPLARGVFVNVHSSAHRRGFLPRIRRKLDMTSVPPLPLVACGVAWRATERRGAMYGKPDDRGRHPCTRQRGAARTNAPAGGAAGERTRLCLGLVFKACVPAPEEVVRAHERRGAGAAIVRIAPRESRAPGPCGAQRLDVGDPHSGAHG
ncbi:hypothetical protein DFH09DRAFT_354588 [Mycena vulgaris]|nr:hypothetical protein DFH09DRAFT_354588 [Mycena vulgaris]